jgi:hypothetical protein
MTAFDVVELMTVVGFSISTLFFFFGKAFFFFYRVIIRCCPSDYSCSRVYQTDGTRSYELVLCSYTITTSSYNATNNALN